MLPNNLTNRGFAFAMARLSANYGREIGEFQQQLYRDHLSHLTDAQLLRAVESLIATSKFLPTVLELKEAAMGAGTTEAELAFESVEQLMAGAGGIVANMDLGRLPVAVRKAAARTTLSVIREMTDRSEVLRTFAAHYATALTEPVTVAAPQLPPPPVGLPREIPKRIAAMAEWATGDRR